VEYSPEKATLYHFHGRHLPAGGLDLHPARVEHTSSSRSNGSKLSCRGRQAFSATYGFAPPLYRHKKGTIWVVNPHPLRAVVNVLAWTRRVCVGKEKEQVVRVSASSCSGRAQKTNDIALGFSLLKRHCLCIRIQRDPAGGVTKELLHDLDIRSVCSQQ